MDTNKKKIKFILSTAVFAIILIYGCYYTYTNFFKPKDLTPKVKQIIEENRQGINKETEKTEEAYVNQLPSYRQTYKNEKIVARLIVPGAKINTLVTRTTDNEFYLTHNIYNEEDVLGNPFIDHRNTDLANDRQINIYGHNTQNEKYYDVLPFTNLEVYTDQNTFNNYKDVTLETDQGRIKYKIIAVKIATSEDNEHMHSVYNSEDDYLDHLNKLMKNTLYKDAIDLTKDDKLLVLQACHYNPNNSYILVICKKVG